MKEKLEKPMDNLQERIEEVLKCWDINVHNEAVGHVNVSQLIRDMQARMVEQDTSKDKLVAALMDLYSDIKGRQDDGANYNPGTITALENIETALKEAQEDDRA